MDWYRKRGCRLFLNVSQNTLCSSQRRILASRIILGLTLMLLLVMPFTEHAWAGDEFMSGGHDAELSLLGELAFCGLIALTADQAIASPMLELLLAHRTTRTPLRQLLRGISVEPSPARKCCFHRRRTVALLVPLSLRPLRI